MYVKSLQAIVINTIVMPKSYSAQNWILSLENIANRQEKQLEKE